MKKTVIIHWISLILGCLLVNNTLYGQCNSTTYSTNPKDSWLSCETRLNPNSSRGNGHWLQYDLGYVYDLGATKFWNYNVTNQTGRGFKQISIDFSLDGITWTEAGTFQLPEADGTTNYEGITGLDLSGYTARFVLITAWSNWSDGICAGLSEVRFDVSRPNNECGDYLVTQNIGGMAIDAGVHYGNTAIEADGIIKDGTAVTFKSPVAITLKAGFTAEAGCQFLAKIENCAALKRPAKLANQPKLEAPQLENNRKNTVVKIYPNPTVHLLNIDFGEKEITDLMIINSAGHEIIRRKGHQNINQIDVSTLPAGMYFINLLTHEQELISKRFVKTSLY